MSRSAEHARPTKMSRTEFLWLAGAMLVGGVLRFWFLNRIAVEHFDEGVYASNFWFGADQGYEYPARYLYAPPLLPVTIEWTTILASLAGARPTGWIPMVPCLLAGIATIPSVWWIARQWFGPVAGTVTAWLVATSDFHASYSRAALTDVPVCLFILWGVYFTWKAIQTGTARDTLLAGLFTGLAWSTKYNGWLPLAVGLAGSAAAWGRTATGRLELRAVAKRWLLVAFTSCLVWSPVLIGLQRHGGYQAVAANHRQYVGGVSGWGTAATRQLQNIGVYDNLLSFWGGSSAAGAGGILNITSPLLLLFVSITGFGAWLWCHRHLHQRASGGWFVLAWIGGLSVATPFYHPYPRLVLPWLTAVWLGVGVAVQLLTESFIKAATSQELRQGRRATWWQTAVVGWLVAILVARGSTGSLHCWQDRTELSKATSSIAELIKTQTQTAGFPEDEAIVYVYGNPPIVFGMKSGGLPLVGPVQNLDFLNSPKVRPTFLVMTDGISPTPAFQQQWAARRSDFSPVEKRPVHLSHLVRLEEDHGADEGDVESIEVYRAH